MSRISSGIAVQFCLFQAAGTMKTLSVHKCSRATYKIMWTAGLPGHRRIDWVSIAWKILSSSLVVLWFPHGLPLRLWTTPWTPKFVWRVEHTITAGRVLFGPTFGDTCCITIVISSQFVPQATFSLHALTFSLVPWRAEIHHDSGSMCFHQGLSSKVRALPDQANPN